MASSTPNQIRTVDPFASYNSDTVNKLTRMLTHGEDGLATANSCNVSLDATSNTKVTLQTGVAYKDDTWINITAQHTVNFNDSNQYYDFGTGFNEAGYYYVIMQYVFKKQRPAPEAEILIVKPSQRSAYVPNGEWLFLKAVQVNWDGVNFYINAVFNYDPTITTNKRQYIKFYSGTEVNLPTFEAQRDTSRIVYTIEEDDFSFGLSDRWASIAGALRSTIQMNTTGFAVGELVYFTSISTIQKATSILGFSTADGVVIRTGVNGLVQTTGEMRNVPIEAGANVQVGDLLYLSKIQSGSITKEVTTPFYQFVGRCVELIDSTTANILFVRGEPSGTAEARLLISGLGSLNIGSWIASGGDFYQDIDISAFYESDMVPTFYDSTSFMIIDPDDVDYISSSVMRIWMPNDITDLTVLIVGPSASSIAASSISAVTVTLDSLSWIASGASFYQDVNVATITSRGASVMVKNAATSTKIKPENIEFTSSTNMRIWMPVNTLDLEIVAIGPSAAVTTLFGVSTPLVSGPTWILSGGRYYQDVDLSAFGDEFVDVEVVDLSTGVSIYPADIEFVTNAVRIWMPDNTHDLNVTVIG